MDKKTMFVTALRVAMVWSNGMVVGSSASLMVNENVEFLFKDFSAVVVGRAFHCDVDLVVATASALPKRWCVDMWRDVKVTG
jgi:hypothetical protein